MNFFLLGRIRVFGRGGAPIGGVELAFCVEEDGCVEAAG